MRHSSVGREVPEYATVPLGTVRGWEASMEERKQSHLAKDCPNPIQLQVLTGYGAVRNQIITTLI